MQTDAVADTNHLAFRCKSRYPVPIFPQPRKAPFVEKEIREGSHVYTIEVSVFIIFL